MTAIISALLLATGAIQFSVDWAAFRAPGDSNRVEFFYAVPFDQLHYSPAEGGGVETQFAVSVAMNGVGTDFAQSGTFRKHARIESFQAAQRAQTTFVDGFSIIAPPGRYAVSLAVVESTGTAPGQGVYTDTIELRSFAGGLALSSLQLGTTTRTDSATGSVAVVPNPALQRGMPGQQEVYVYLEGYGFAADTGSYAITLGLLKRSADRVDTVLKAPPVERTRQSRRIATALGLNIEGVEPGRYALFAELRDSATGAVARSEHELQVGVPEPAAPTSGWLETLRPNELKYVRDIKYLATQRELDYYNSLGDSGKMTYLAWFWTRRDLPEFARRMEHVEQRYARPKTSGISTDRGRIYVKYGEPDAVEQRVIESDLRSREYWQYYGTGYTFVFIDIRGDGNLRLAWTNSPDERSTGYEQYLSPEEEQQFK
jgi:GWxTD domain-containing protein